MVLLAEASQRGKANPYPEYVSIQMRTNIYLFHMKNVQCHHPTLVNCPQPSLPKYSAIVWVTHINLTLTHQLQRAHVGFSGDR